jgi:hypothetical protein
MIWRPTQPAPKVKVHPEAVRDAQTFIEEHYEGVERKDMEAWLRRFVKEVHEDPFRVLGYPPTAAASDPTLLKYPVQEGVPIGAEAYVQMPDTTIHVHAITPRSPQNLIEKQAAQDAKSVARAGEQAEKGVPKAPYDKSSRAKALRDHEAKRRRNP